MANKGIIIDVGFDSQGGINELINNIEKQLKQVDFDSMIGLSSAFDSQAKDVRQKLSKLKDEINEIVNGKVTGTQDEQLKILNKSVKTLTDNFKNLVAAMPGNNDDTIKQLSAISSEIQEVSGMCENAVDAVVKLKTATKGDITIVSSNQKKELEELFNLLERANQATEQMDRPRKKRGNKNYEDEEDALRDLIHTFEVFSNQQKEFNSVFNDNSLDAKSKTKQLDTLAASITNTGTSFMRLIATVRELTEDWGSFEPFNNGKNLIDFERWMAPQIDKYLDYISKRKAEIQAAYSELGGDNLLDRYIKDEKKEKDKPITIKLSLDSKAKENLTSEVLTMLGEVQEVLDETPLQIEVQLMSGYQSRANRKVLEQLQAELSKADFNDKKITEKVQGLIDRMNRYMENAMIFTVDVQTQKAFQKIKEFISKTKKYIKENPLELDVSFNQDASNIKSLVQNLDKLQKKVDEVSMAFVDQSAVVKYSVSDTHNYLSGLFDDLISIRKQILSVNDLIKTLNQSISVELDFSGFVEEDGELFQADILEALSTLSSALNSISSAFKDSMSEFLNIPEADKNKFLGTVNELAIAVKKIFDTSDISNWSAEAINAFSQVGIKLQKQIGDNPLSHLLKNFDFISKVREDRGEKPLESGFVIDENGKIYGGIEDTPNSNSYVHDIKKRYNKETGKTPYVVGHTHGSDRLVSSSLSQYRYGDKNPRGADLAADYIDYKDGVKYGLTVARNEYEVIDYEKLYGLNKNIDFSSSEVIKKIADKNEELKKELKILDYASAFLNNYSKKEDLDENEISNYLKESASKITNKQLSDFIKNIDPKDFINALYSEGTTGRAIKSLLGKNAGIEDAYDLGEFLKLNVDYNDSDDNVKKHINDIYSSEMAIFGASFEKRIFDLFSNKGNDLVASLFNRTLSSTDRYRDLAMFAINESHIKERILSEALGDDYAKGSYDEAVKRYTPEEFKSLNPLGLSSEELDNIDNSAKEITVDLTDVTEKLDKLISQLDEISKKTIEINIDKSSIDELISELKKLPEYISNSTNASSNKVNDLLTRKAELEKKLVELEKQKKDIETAQKKETQTPKDSGKKKKSTSTKKGVEPKKDEEKKEPKKSVSKTTQKKETQTQSNNLVKLTREQIKLAEQITQNNLHSVSKLAIKDKFGAAPGGKDVKALMAAGILGKSPSNPDVIESGAKSIDKLNVLLADVIAKEVSESGNPNAITKSQILGIAKLIKSKDKGVNADTLRYSSGLSVNSPLFESMRKAGLISVEKTTKDIFDPQDGTTIKKEINIVKTSIKSMGELVDFINNNLSKISSPTKYKKSYNKDSDSSEYRDNKSSKILDSVNAIVERTNSNIEKLGESNEYGFAGNIFDNNAVTRIIEGGVAGISTESLNDVIKDSSDEFKSNFVAHSHDEEIFAFSPDDVDEMAKQLENEIVYQIGIGLKESAIFNAGEFTSEQLSEIASIMREKAFLSYEDLLSDPKYQSDNGVLVAEAYAGKIVDEESALMDMFRNNFVEGMNYIFNKLGLTSEEGFKYLEGNINRIGGLLKGELDSDEGINIIKNAFYSFDNIDSVIDSFIKFSNQSYINKSFVDAIKQVSPETVISDVFKKSSVSDFSSAINSVAKLSKKSRKNKTNISTDDLSTKSKKPTDLSIKDSDVTIGVEVEPIVSNFVDKIVSQLSKITIPINVEPNFGNNKNSSGLPDVYLTDEYGETIKWYRTVNDSLTGLFSSSDRGSFATNNLNVSLSYRKDDNINEADFKTYEEEIRLTDKILEINDNNNEYWNRLSYLGNGYDEQSKEIRGLVKKLKKFKDLKKDISERFGYYDLFGANTDVDYVGQNALITYGKYNSGENKYSNLSNEEITEIFEEAKSIIKYLNSPQGMGDVYSSEEIRSFLKLKHFKNYNLGNIDDQLKFDDELNLLLYTMYKSKLLSKDDFTIPLDDDGYPDYYDPTEKFPEMLNILKYLEEYVDSDEESQKIIIDTFKAAKRITEINADENNIYGYTLPKEQEYSHISGKTNVETNDFVRKASAKGLDAVIFRNIYDTAAYDTKERADIISVLNNSIISKVHEMSLDELKGSQDKLKMIDVIDSKPGDIINDIIKKRLSEILLEGFDTVPDNVNDAIGIDAGINELFNNNYKDFYESILDYIYSFLRKVNADKSYNEIIDSAMEDFNLSRGIFNGIYSRMSWFDHDEDSERSNSFWDIINSNMKDFVGSVFHDIGLEAKNREFQPDLTPFITSDEDTLENQVSSIKSLVENIWNYLSNNGNSNEQKEFVNLATTTLSQIVEKSNNTLGENNVVSKELPPLIKFLLDSQRDDNIMANQTVSPEAMPRERSMVSDKDGNIFGQYTYDQLDSNSFGEILLKKAKENGLDASISYHSHGVDNYAAMSPSFFNDNKKVEEGDISAFFTELKDGIKIQITQGLKDFQIFDAEGFYNYGNNKNIKWDSSAVQRKIADADAENDKLIKGDFVNHVIDYLDYADEDESNEIVDAIGELFRTQMTSDVDEKEFNKLFSKIDKDALVDMITTRDAEAFKRLIMDTFMDLGASSSLVGMIKKHDFSFDNVKSSKISGALSNKTYSEIMHVASNNTFDRLLNMAGIGYESGSVNKFMRNYTPEELVSLDPLGVMKDSGETTTSFEQVVAKFDSAITKLNSVIENIGKSTEVTATGSKKNKKGNNNDKSDNKPVKITQKDILNGFDTFAGLNNILPILEGLNDHISEYERLNNLLESDSISNDDFNELDRLSTDINEKMAQKAQYESELNNIENSYKNEYDKALEKYNAQKQNNESMAASIAASNQALQDRINEAVRKQSERDTKNFNAKQELIKEVDNTEVYKNNSTMSQVVVDVFSETFTGIADEVYKYIRDTLGKENPLAYLNSVVTTNGNVDSIKAHNALIDWGFVDKLPEELEQKASAQFANTVTERGLIDFIKKIILSSGEIQGSIRTTAGTKNISGAEYDKDVYNILLNFARAIVANKLDPKLHNGYGANNLNNDKEYNELTDDVLIAFRDLFDMINYQRKIGKSYTDIKNDSVYDALKRFVDKKDIELKTSNIEIVSGRTMVPRSNRQNPQITRLVETPAVYIRDNNVNAAKGIHVDGRYIDDNAVSSLQLPTATDARGNRITNPAFNRFNNETDGAGKKSNRNGRALTRMLIANGRYTTKLKKNYSKDGDGSTALSEKEAEIQAVKDEIADIVRQLSELGTSSVTSNVSDIATAISELATSGENSDKTVAFFKSLNTLISNLTGDKASKKMTEFKDSVKELSTALSGFKVNNNSLLSQLGNILSKTSELKSLENILKNSEAKIKSTTKSQLDAENLKKAQELLANNGDKINSDFSAFAQNNSFEVLTKDITATKDGLVQIVALIKDANDEYKQLTYTTGEASKNSNGDFVFAQSGESTGFKIDKKVRAYQKWVESTKNATGIPNIGTSINSTSPLAEMNFSPTDGDLSLWQELVNLMNAFGIKENDILNVTRKLDGEYESFIVKMKDGTSKIIGMSSDIVLSQYQEVVSIDKEVEEFKALNAELKKISTLEVIDASTSSRISEISQRINDLIDKFKKLNAQGILDDSDLSNLEAIKNNTGADISNKLIDTKAVGIYSNLIKISKQYFKLIKSNTGTEQQKTQIADLQNEWQTNVAELQKYYTLIQALPEKTKKLVQVQGEFNAIANSSYQNPVTENLAKNYNKLVGLYEKQTDKSGFSEEFVSDYKTLVNNFESLQSNLPNINIFDANDLRLVTAMNEEIVKMITDIKSLDNVAADSGQVLKLLSKINTDMHDNSAMSKELKARYDALKQSILGFNGVISKGELKNLTEEFLRLHNTMIESEQTGKSMAQRIKDAVKSQTSQFIAQYFSLQDFIRYGRQAFNTIIGLDTALVDLKKTTSMSNSELNDFYYDANGIAKTMGVTTENIISQAAAWSRLGYSSKEASETLATLSSQFASISPGMTTETAQSGMVSIMQAFDIGSNDAERKILDNINVVGNNFALTNADVVAGLEKSSAALNAANNSLEQSIALIASGTEITQDAEAMGTALRTISMRIRGYDEESEELSDEYENLSGTIADLTKSASAPGGISLFTDSSKTEYKSTYQILKEISQIWDELTDKNQAQLLEKMFGKTRANQGAAILSNFEKAEEAMMKMDGAAGNADKEMGTIRESIDFKINELKQTWVGIVQNILSREDIGEIVDGLTEISVGLGNIATNLSPIISMVTSLIRPVNQLLSSVTKLMSSLGTFGSVATVIGLKYGANTIINNKKNGLIEKLQEYGVIGKQEGNNSSRNAKIKGIKKELSDKFNKFKDKYTLEVPVEDAEEDSIFDKLADAKDKIFEVKDKLSEYASASEEGDENALSKYLDADALNTAGMEEATAALEGYNAEEAKLILTKAGVTDAETQEQMIRAAGIPITESEILAYNQEEIAKVNNMLATEGLVAAEGQYNLTTLQGIEELEAEILAREGLSAAQRQNISNYFAEMKAKRKDYTTNTKTKVNGKAIAKTGLTLGVMALAAAYSYASSKEEELASAIEKSNSEYESAKKETDGYKEKIEDLYKIINNSSSTVDEVSEARENLLSIQDELIEKYGSEKDGIDAVTAAINGQTDALDGLNEAKLNQIRADISNYDNNGWAQTFNKIGNFFSQLGDTRFWDLNGFFGLGGSGSETEMAAYYDNTRKYTYDDAKTWTLDNGEKVGFYEMYELVKADPDNKYYSEVMDAWAKWGTLYKAETEKSMSAVIDNADNVKKAYSDAFKSGNQSALDQAVDNFDNLIDNIESKYESTADEYIAYLKEKYPELFAASEKKKIKDEYEGNRSFYAQQLKDFMGSDDGVVNESKFIEEYNKVEDKDGNVFAKRTKELMSAYGYSSIKEFWDNIIEAELDGINGLDLVSVGEEAFKDKLNAVYTKSEGKTERVKMSNSDLITYNLDESKLSNAIYSIDKDRIVSDREYARLITKSFQEQYGEEISLEDIIGLIYDPNLNSLLKSDITFSLKDENGNKIANSEEEFVNMIEKQILNNASEGIYDWKTILDNSIDEITGNILKPTRVFASDEAESKYNDILNWYESLSDGDAELINNATLSADILSLDKLNEKLIELRKNKLEASKVDVVDQSEKVDSYVEGGLSDLVKMYEDIQNGGEFDYSSLVNNETFKRNFSSLDSYKDFYNAVMNSNGKMTDEIQDKFDTLATEKAYTLDFIWDVNDDNLQSTVNRLYQEGIVNAEDFANNMLEKTKLADEAYVEYGVDVKKVNMDDYKSFMASKEATDESKKAVSELILTRYAYNKTSIDSDEDIENLISIANAAGVATDAIIEYRNKVEELFKDYSNDLKDFEEEFGEDVSGLVYIEYKDDFEAASKEAKENIKRAILDADDFKAKVSSDAKSVSAAWDNEVNWIERAIKRLEVAMTKLQTVADSTYESWSDRNKSLADELGVINEQIETNTAAASYYLQKFNELGLSGEYKTKVMNGEINLENIKNDDEKALIDRAIMLWDNYTDSVQTASDKQQEYYSTIEKQFNNTKTQYEELINEIQHTTTMLESSQSLLQAQGYKASESLYRALIENEASHLATLEAEKAALEEKLSTNGIKEGTEGWYNMKSEINSVEEAILSAKQQLVEFNNELRQLSWDKFDDFMEGLQDIADEASFLVDILSGRGLTDDYGLNDRGIAAQAEQVAKYNLAIQQSIEYSEELARLRKEIEADPGNNDLIDRYKTLKDAQQSVISNAESERKAILDVAREGYDALGKTMSELISKYNDMISSIKDTYDYQKTMTEKTKELSNLQKQFAAYANDTSEEAMSKRQQLEQSIEKAQDDIEQTEYERLISDTSKLLTDLQDDYEEWLEDLFENRQEEVIKNALETTNENIGSIDSTLKSILDAYKYDTNDNEQNTVFEEGITVMTGLTNAINNVKSNIEQLYKDRAGTDNTNGITGADGTTSSSAPTVNVNTPDNSSSSSNSSAASSGNSGDGTAKSGDICTLKAGSKYYENSYGTGRTGNKFAGVEGGVMIDDKSLSSVVSGGTRTKGGSYGVHIMAADGSYKDLGWVQLSDLTGYATGGKNIKDEFAWTQENGGEIIRTKDGGVLTPVKGSTVFNADMTDTLWNFAKDPMNFLNANSLEIPNVVTTTGTSQNNSAIFNIDKVVADNPEQFTNNLRKSLANDKNVQKMVQTLSVDQMMGGNSLKVKQFM